METATEVRRGNAWSWLIPSGLAAVLLYLSVRGVDWRRVWSLIAHADWLYLTGCGMTAVASFTLRAVRWRILLNAEGKLSFGTVFASNMAGYLGNNFLPARAGELVRTFMVSQQSKLSKTYVLTTALAERMLDAIALVLWSSVLLLQIGAKPRWLADVSRSTALIASAGALAILVLPHTGRLCETVIRRIPMPVGLRDRLLRFADQILSGLRALHDLRRLGGFVGLTVVIWLLDALGVMAGAHGVGVVLPFGVAALLLCAMALGSALPSTPGYVGIYQFVAVTVLVPFGVSRDEALAMTLVGQAIGYVVVLILGLPGILRYRAWRKAEAD
jgi:uncharacterized protein (TIRG00374 family)